jgi:hypothetical protein
MTAEDACFFNQLPFDMRASFLHQVFKLLDQHHQFTVVPLVCHLWRRLVPSTCSSLEVKVENQVAAKGLASWLERYQTPLESIDLDFKWYWSSRVAEGKKLLEVVCSKVSLQSLSILDPHASVSITPLPSLTQLTSLTMLTLSLSDTTCKALVLPTQLRHLDLNAWDAGDEFPWLGDVVGSLAHLTTLELAVGSGPIKPQQLLPLTTLRSLRDLQLPYTDVMAEGLVVLKQLPFTHVKLRADRDDVLDMCSWLKKGRGLLTTLDLMGHAYESLEELELFLSHLRTFAPQLRDIEINCMRQLGDSTGLAGLTQLTRLSVIMECDGAGMRSLQALTGLRDLDIWTSEQTGAAGWPFECLASSLQQLTFLGLPNENDSEDMREAHEAAKRAFGSRVVESDSESLMLKPGVPAWE